MTAVPERPVTILIAALGGEGGGVLSGWLVEAATAQGFPVQSTSIPGVAQRTGATTYYLEIYPVPAASLGGRRPVLALTPSPGNVDIMVASELMEAGRALQNGYVGPDRTTLIASTHRIFSIAEKSAMGDGRYDASRVTAAARELARQPILFDMARLAQRSGSVINAVLFGAMAGAGALPLPREACEAAIRASGKAVEANLRGFAAGHACAAGEAPPEEAAAPAIASAAPAGRLRDAFPPAMHAVLAAGVERLSDYQDEAYAGLYLDRLQPIIEIERDGGDDGYPLSRETARHLSLWMAYEDVIRVAQLKTRPDRVARLRAETGARPDEPIVVREFLKPGLGELCSILPPRPAAAILGWARTRGLEDRLAVGMTVTTTSVWGFLLLRSLARLRRWRRGGARFAEEQALIERWLAAIRKAAVRDRDLALEIVLCARLLKGYGETHRRGLGNFLRIFETLVEPAAANADPQGLAAAIRAAREAALADPDGDALDRALAAAPVPAAPPIARAGE